MEGRQDFESVIKRRRVRMGVGGFVVWCAPGAVAEGVGVAAVEPGMRRERGA